MHLEIDAVRPSEADDVALIAGGDFDVLDATVHLAVGLRERVFGIECSCGARTPLPAATLRSVFFAAWYASALATGAAKTVIVTVAVELPAAFCSLYLKVSVPTKFVAGV